VIPEGCTGAAASAPPPSPEGAQPKTTEVTLLDGVWEVTYSMDEFVAADPDPSEVMPENYGHFTVTFRRGIWENQGTGQSPVTGTYAVVGDTITFYGSSSDPGAVWSYKWSVYRDTLTFEKLGGQEPGCSLGQCEPTVYVVKPWRRVSL
jgi:hypothetical protein